MDPIKAPKLPAHIPSLDGLRALSIALVLFGHVAATNGAPLWLDRPMFTSLGNVGVRFFFIVSGFLITTLMLRDIEKHGQIRLKLFYVRRSLRILPAALVYIAVMWGLYLTGVIDLTYHLTTRTHADSALPDLLHALTFTANYQYDYNWYFNHLWSLSVEEQFYLVWPFTMFLIGTRRAVWAGLLILVLAPCIRWWMFTQGTGPEIRLSREFQAVADALATGCLAAMLHNKLGEWRWFEKLTRWPAIPIGLGLVATGYGLAYVYRPSAYLIGQTIANIGIALILQHLVRHPTSAVSQVLNTRFLVKIGVLSYSLYLWQQPFLNFQSTHWVASFPQNIVLAFAAALLSQKLVERPFLKLKDRIA
jgi:peptidoglycan/LPS O-acetylase OafA/YrhL